MTVILIIAIIAFVYGIFSKKFETSLISGPMVFVILGGLLGPALFGLVGGESGDEVLKIFAELTLALVLFTDASTANMKVVSQAKIIPRRMLIIGLPFAILLGLGLAMVIFDEFTILEAAILAIVLAPTDAALGKAVVSNPNVPVRIRQSLNVESGLNDGIAVPFLLLTLALLDSGGKDISVLMFFLKAIGIGAAVGLGMTYVGTTLLKMAKERGWINHLWEKIILVTLAFSIFILSEHSGGSGFIACFVGGLLFGVMAKKEKEEFVEAVEGIGDLLALVTWVLFGALIANMILPNMEWSYLLYAVLSLTVIRMLPIFVSLFKSGVSTNEKLFLGWFGPRGLASIVFAVLIMDAHFEHKDPILVIISLTIFLSVVLHGITASPYANWLGRNTKAEE